MPLPSGGVLALVTLDNGRDHTRPSTLGPATLLIRTAADTGATGWANCRRPPCSSTSYAITGVSSRHRRSVAASRCRAP
ncbi:hypothetical protein CMMCAS05_02725 [Clavibacter michiganensis subsp. michiganensis]|nr:hypothetical protein CMMCAS05_02725 [Clavibacter michiganensis subsp. michiganensis]